MSETRLFRVPTNGTFPLSISLPSLSPLPSNSTPLNTSLDRSNVLQSAAPDFSQGRVRGRVARGVDRGQRRRQLEEAHEEGTPRV